MTLRGNVVRPAMYKAMASRWSSTLPRVLSQAEAIANVANNTKYWAYYSSTFGGIVTDPRLMLLPSDDHGVHRGHAVFDTANITPLAPGKLYGLSMHLDRLLRSARDAKIAHSFSKDHLRSIVLGTVAATKQRDGGFVRYWLTAGPGDYSIHPAHCTASFYCVVHEDPHSFSVPTQTSAAVTVPVPLKPPALARMKTTNYMLNAHVQIAAVEAGADIGVQFTADSYLQESAVSMLAVVDKNGVLCLPPFDSILASTTMNRIIALAPTIEGITRVEQRPVHRDEVFSAQELINIGGGFVTPLGTLDGQRIGNGEVGPIFKAVHSALLMDFSNAEMLDPIPYEEY